MYEFELKGPCRWESKPPINNV